MTVPEVARLLRPGGLLAFAQTSPLLYLTWDERRERQDTKLHRSYFGLGRLELGDGTIDFQIPHGEWFRLFREHGLSVEDFIELRPARRRDDDVRRLRAPRLGPPLARRADLEGPEARAYQALTRRGMRRTVVGYSSIIASGVLRMRSRITRPYFSE